MTARAVRLPAALLLAGCLFLANARPARTAQSGGSLSDADAKQALADLKSSNHDKRKSAAEMLAKTSPDEAHRAKITAALCNLMSDTNGNVRSAAAKALDAWAGKESVTRLVPLVSHRDIFVRHDTMEVLGHVPDSRAAAAVAARLTNGLDRGAAGKSLKAMGSAAESSVIPFVGSRDPRVREEAVSVLKEIGTRKSLNALSGARGDPDPKVAAAAKEAFDAVKGR